MSTEDDISQALKFLKIIVVLVMHCVSTYPLKQNMVNMSTINELKKNINVMLAIVDMKME